MCGRIAGHKATCELYTEPKSTNFSRTRIFDTASVLWYQSQSLNFFTFTLPSWEGYKTYQLAADCCVTGDIAVSAKFSMLLELISVNIKRVPKSKKGRKKKSTLWKRWNNGKFSYLWVAEAQQERQEKFGGIGDIHFHLITNAYIPIKWITAAWSKLLGADSKSCVHVDHIPGHVNSVPNYLAKYFGKGVQRKILSRRFSCTRDLSGVAPIKLKRLPEGTLLKHKSYTTKQGFEINFYYYDTGEVLANYLEFMKEEASVKGVTRISKDFTQPAILARALSRDKRTNHLTTNTNGKADNVLLGRRPDKGCVQEDQKRGNEIQQEFLRDTEANGTVECPF